VSSFGESVVGYVYCENIMKARIPDKNQCERNAPLSLALLSLIQVLSQAKGDLFTFSEQIFLPIGKVIMRV